MEVITIRKIFSAARSAVLFYIDKRIAPLSAQLSYYMIFTFFPVLLLANSLAGNFIPENFSLPLSNVIPEPIRNFANSYISEIGDVTSGKLIFLGAALTLYSLTRYIRFYRAALRSIYEKSRRLNFFLDWILSFLFSLGMLVLFYLAVFSVFFADSFLSLMGFSDFVKSIWYVLRFFIIALYAFIVICALHFVECGSKERFMQFAPGALCSVGLWTVISVIFSYYAKEIANYSVVYGSIGNVIMLLLWLNLTNTILLMGGLVNISLNNRS